MQAQIFFGSSESLGENFTQRQSPYSGEVVSTAPICDAKDAIKALKIASSARKAAKSSTLSQR